jgi:hypothetical protein
VNRLDIYPAFWTYPTQVLKRSTTLLLTAALAIPTAVAVVVWVAYSVALAHGTLPFSNHRAWIGWVVFGAALIGGAGCVIGSRITTGLRLSLIVLAYAAAMTVVLFDIHLVIADTRLGL